LLKMSEKMADSGIPAPVDMDELEKGDTTC